MKKKLFCVKLGKLALLLSLLFLFTVIYLLPSIKGINHLKRNIKNKTIAINDFSKIEQKLSFPSQREKLCFKEADQQLRQIIPKVKHKDEEAALWLEHANYLLSRAGNSDIHDLIICSAEQGDKINIIGQTPGSKANVQLARFIQKKRDDALLKARLDMLHLGGGNISLFGRDRPVRSALLLVAFRADVKKGARFVNHVTPGEALAHMVSLQIYGDRGLPFWLMMVRFYYFDTTAVSDSIIGDTGRDYPLIDLNADILLRDICPYVRQWGERKFLPDQFGGKIFSTFPKQAKDSREKAPGR